MSAEEEDVPATEDDKRKTFDKLFHFVDEKKREVEIERQELDKKYQKWKPMRQETITITERAAELIKILNDKTTPIQGVCKGICVLGKLFTLGDPVTSAVGAAASLIADVTYSVCSKCKIEQVEKMCDEVQCAMKKDAEETKSLLRLVNHIGQISEDIRKGVKKFHSATINGFFDDVPALQSFVTAVSAIQDIEDPAGITKFLVTLWHETQNLVEDSSSIRLSFGTLSTYNPGVTELATTIPEIILSGSIFCSAVSKVRAKNAEEASSVGNVQKFLTALAITQDIKDICTKVSEFDKYPKLSEDLMKIQRKLEQELEEITELAMKMTWR